MITTTFKDGSKIAMSRSNIQAAQGPLFCRELVLCVPGGWSHTCAWLSLSLSLVDLDELCGPVEMCRQHAVDGVTDGRTGQRLFCLDVALALASTQTDRLRDQKRRLVSRAHTGLVGQTCVWPLYPDGFVPSLLYSHATPHARRTKKTPCGRSTQPTAPLLACAVSEFSHHGNKSQRVPLPWTPQTVWCSRGAAFFSFSLSFRLFSFFT